MKRSQIVGVVVSLFILTTISVLSGQMTGYGQANTQNKKPTPTRKKFNEKKYVVVDFDAPESSDPKERERRKKVGKRYDKMRFVEAQPHPETARSKLFDYAPRLSLFPVKESFLIVIGEIINSRGGLSNDKKGIYSEFNVKLLDFLKKPSQYSLKRNVRVDREGGYVRYRNGQKVLYRIAGQDLPAVGKRYLLFLSKTDASKNYKILTGYELNTDSVRPIDSVPFDYYFDKNEAEFIDIVRKKITERNFRTADGV